jgi:hypothetical protein
MERKQLFRHYDIFNGDKFLEYLKKIHTKFPKCFLFIFRMNSVIPNRFILLVYDV